jgi:hypothetical protein
VVHLLKNSIPRADEDGICGSIALEYTFLVGENIQTLRIGITFFTEHELDGDPICIVGIAFRHNPFFAPKTS